MEKVLVNTNEYNGKYVALVSVEDNTIVGAGVTPEEALNKAKKNGIQSPLLLYVPEKDLVYC